MKLIIDIPEEEYFVIKHYGDIPLNKTYFTAMSIINGIPLDKIRAEIEQYKISNHALITVKTALAIIDKYRNEVSK